MYGDVINKVNTGQRIKELSRQKGLSAKKLGEATYRCKQEVYKWYSGVATPPIDALVLLSEIYEVPLDELLVRDSPQ